MDKMNGSDPMDTSEKKVTSPVTIPANGALLIDGKTATSVSFERSDNTGEARFDVTFKLASKVVQKERDLSDTQLESAVGKQNAQRIKSDGQPKGTLRGEELAYATGISAAVIADRVRQNVERSIAGFGEEAIERARQQRMRDRAALNIKTEPNEIIDVSTRDRTPAQLVGSDGPQSSATKDSRSMVADVEPHGVVAVEADELASRIKEALSKRYIEADKAFHFRHGSGVNDVAFTHSHSNIVSRHSNVDVVRDMVALSVAKGWTEIKLTGSDDFKREAWLEASLYGLKVDGYKPREVDRVRLDELRADEARRTPFSRAGTAIVNEIQKAATVREYDETKTTAVPFRREDHERTEENRSTPPAKDESAVITELRHIMLARGDSEKAIAMAAAVATERLERQQNVMVGTLKAHGHAPYKNLPDEKPSYYVALETRVGEKTLWGVDLQRALAETDAQAGQLIALENLGHKAVTVDENVRDEQGQVVATQRVVAHRNEWGAVVLDQADAAMREQFSLLDSRQQLQPTLPESYNRRAMSNIDRQQPARHRSGMERE